MVILAYLALAIGALCGLYQFGQIFDNPKNSTGTKVVSVILSIALNIWSVLTLASVIGWVGHSGWYTVYASFGLILCAVGAVLAISEIVMLKTAKITGLLILSIPAIIVYLHIVGIIF